MTISMPKDRKFYGFLITEYTFYKKEECKKQTKKVYTKNISSIYLFNIVLADETMI